MLRTTLQGQRQSHHAAQLRSDRWRWKLAAASQLRVQEHFARAALYAWANEAVDEARRIGQELAGDARKSWHSFMDEQLRTGAGTLHKLTKRTTIPADDVVLGDFGPSLGLQSVVDADLKVWREVWHKYSGLAAAPWREAGIHEFSWAAPLDEITVEDLISVAPTYRRRTGLGVDGFHPRWFAWLSRPVLEGFVVLLNTLES